MGKKEHFYVDIMAAHPEVTGSCLLTIVKFPNGKTTKFIVDCGLFQEREHEELNSGLLFDAESLDFCLVTHNHVDHTGRLPLLVKNGFYKSIYATETTCKLLPNALEDSLKVLADVAKRKNEKALYNETDFSRTLSLLKPCPFFEPVEITDHIKVTFLSNGHLIGASMILVQISYPEQEDINLLFTGDYNNKNIFFDVLPVPDWVKKLQLTVIQESTYGDMDSSEIENVFKGNLIKCLNNSGTAIIPVFSLGRAQEILYYLKVMEEEGLINVPIYFDGKLAIKYTNMYLKTELGIKEEMKNFLPPDLIFVDKNSRTGVLLDTKSKIIVSTAGMGSYGPVQTYIHEYVGKKNVLIHFTGYTSEGTLGRRLKDTEQGKGVEIGGVIIKKNATVEHTTEFSAHAKADEMIEFLQQFENLKLILVNHGENETKDTFAHRIADEVKVKGVGILGREYFFRINPYGLVKSLSTKFK